MFTGIVERCGSIVNREDRGESSVFKIDLGNLVDDTVIGDSVSVNGCCLTVTELQDSLGCFDVMTETLKVTSLAELTSSDLVNLEPARKLGDKLGGHLVSGHVDVTGKVVGIAPGDECHVVDIQVTQSFFDELVLRGSVAVDGTSLTIMNLDAASLTFSVSIIPHTWAVTRFQSYEVGSIVNLEADMIGKFVRHHVERLLGETQP